MRAISEKQPLSPPEVNAHAARAERLLDGMHKVFRHDLPNQMLALQSLLQLLELEESARLSDDGREYVRRLQNAARRASEMVRFLKEMSRLNAFTAKAEPISLEVLARELQGELQRLHPAREFAFEWQWHAPTVVGDGRVLVQAILELCAATAPAASKLCRVQAHSKAVSNAVVLAFRINDGTPKSVPPGAPADRIEFVLAREWLALCGANVDVSLDHGGESSFSIVVPQ